MRTAIFDRAKYASDFKARHRLYENKQYKVFKVALDKQVEPVISYVKAYGAISPELSDMLVTKAPMEVAYKECYTTIGSAHAEWTRRRVNSIGKQQKSFFSENWQRILELFFLNESASRVSDVTDTTRERIRQVLAETVSLNLSISQAATYIVDKLSNSDFNRMRALVIARTESTTAANKGALLGAESADYETGKVWIPIIDNRTRLDHRLMNDEPAIAMNEAFNVGGNPMQYPGDPTAPAKEVVQCRCALGVVPLLDINGLPILK